MNTSNAERRNQQLTTQEDWAEKENSLSNLAKSVPLTVARKVYEAQRDESTSLNLIHHKFRHHSLEREKGRDFSPLLSLTTFSAITSPSPYKSSFSSTTSQLFVIRIFSEKCQMTERFFSRINETFLLLIMLLSKVRAGREQWKLEFQRQEHCQSALRNSGIEPNSYQQRRRIFHSLIASHGYFQKM